MWEKLVYVCLKEKLQVSHPKRTTLCTTTQRSCLNILHQENRNGSEYILCAGIKLDSVKSLEKIFPLIERTFPESSDGKRL